MRIELKGILTYVGEIQKRKTGFPVREIVLSKQFADDFGTIHKSIYPMQIAGDDVEKLTPVHGDRVVIIAYLNGNESDGKFYLSLRVKSITSQSKS